jgi:urea transport system permease protein
LFIAVTLHLPRGIVGTLQHWWAERKASKAERDAAAVADPAPRPAK